MQFQDTIKNEYQQFLNSKTFPCVAAKDAMAKDRIKIFMAENIACPKDDKAILDFLYSFTHFYRNSGKGFYSAAVIFEQTELIRIVIEAIQQVMDELGDMPEYATKLIHFLNSKNKYELQELDIEDRTKTILEVRKVLSKRNLMLNLEDKCQNM